MILDLRQFENFPAHLSLRAQPGEVVIDYESVVQVNDAQLDLDIQKSGEEFFCQGQARASVRLTCARCLEEFDRELANTTDFIVCSKQWHDNHRDVKDNEDYIFFEGGDLQADVTDMVRQAVIISMSMKPLCSEDCRGLCASCGANLNEKSCGCKTEQTDERWEALRRLSGLT
ncbi:MAG: DUF177 domain-containing protein [Candidatus Zixiibacteriota bacterium]|nr:MAG: DUF177 domain-containing protein [candidate division Zixibacteria bacterium]